MQAIVRDVSARYEAEQTVRQSEERFRLLYQYLPIAYQSLSEHGTIVMVNDAWLALTGLTRGQAVGRRFVDLLASESLDAYESRFRRAILSGDVHDVELTLVRGDRARVTVSIDGRRGQNEHGELRVHCALHDVTAARQADARLRQSEERYRTLFDESPISMWEEDFSGIRRHLDRLQALGVADFETHFVAHPEELDDCIGAVKVVDVNRATLALYGADSRSQLLAGLDRIIGEDGRDVFRRSIVALAGGARTWRDEGINYTLGQPADSPRAPLVDRARSGADVVPRAGVGRRHHRPHPRRGRAARVRGPVRAHLPLDTRALGDQPAVGRHPPRRQRRVPARAGFHARRGRRADLGRTGSWGCSPDRFARAPGTGRSAGRGARAAPPAGAAARARPFEGVLSVVALRVDGRGLPARSGDRHDRQAARRETPPARASGGWPAS